LAGLSLGIAHMAKASALPVIGIFGGTFLIILLSKLLQAINSRERLRVFLAQIGHLLAVLVGFLAVTFYYFNESKQIYGQYTYNVNSTFYIWFDDWDGALQAEEAYDFGAGWPDMPPEELPSLKNYLRDHSWRQIWDRLWIGLTSQVRNLITLYSRYNYLMLYSAALLIGFFSQVNKSKKLLLQYSGVLIFSLAYLVVNILLFSWIEAIAGGGDERFTYTLFIPIMFSLFAALTKTTEINDMISIGKFSIKTSNLAVLANAIILSLISFEVLFVIPENLINPIRWYGK
jgi:hypothetical protein